MNASRLEDKPESSLPRKVANLLIADVRVRKSIERLAIVAKSRYLVFRALSGILNPNSLIASDVLGILAVGVCGSSPVKYASLSHALKQDDNLSAWRASMLAVWAECILATVKRTELPLDRICATQWAIAETAYWYADKCEEDPDEAFSQALLMDCGLVAMMYTFPEIYIAFAASRSQKVLEVFEANAFGFDHQAVGYELLKVGRFSDELMHRAARHHAPSLPTDRCGHVVQAAMIAVGFAGGDFGLNLPPQPFDALYALDQEVTEEDAQGLTAIASSNLRKAFTCLPQERFVAG